MVNFTITIVNMQPASPNSFPVIGLLLTQTVIRFPFASVWKKAQCTFNNSEKTWILFSIYWVLSSWIDLALFGNSIMTRHIRCYFSFLSRQTNGPYLLFGQRKFRHTPPHPWLRLSLSVFLSISRRMSWDCSSRPNYIRPWPEYPIFRTSDTWYRVFIYSFSQFLFPYLWISSSWFETLISRCCCWLS